MSGHRLRVGVVGLGIGRSHLEAYQSLPDLFDIVAVCDLQEARARAAAEQFNAPHIAADFDALCRRDDLDVIDICTPPYLHFAQIQQALDTGHHVVCEKPLVSSLAEVDRLMEAESASGRRVMPIFQYRFGHGLQKLKWLVEAGVAGEAYLATVETAWRRGPDYYAVPWRGKWRTELGGSLVSHAIHGHDMLTYILGPVRSVFARLATRVNPIETEDCASISLEMADGSLASLSVTLGSAVEITRHRFCFAGLTAESNLRPYTNSHDPWTFSGTSSEADAAIQAILDDFEPLPERFPGQFYHLYHALRGDGPLPATLADARASLELVTAMYASARSGEAVPLPLTADHPLYKGWLPEGA